MSIPVHIHRKTPPGQRGIPGCIDKNPAGIDPDPACQVVCNGETGRKLAEFRGIGEIRIIPQEWKRGIDNLVSKPSVHLREKVVFWSAISLPKIQHLLWCSDRICHGN
jgi:hypothetical protein